MTVFVARLVRSPNHVADYFETELDLDVRAGLVAGEQELVHVEFLEDGCLLQLGDWVTWRLV